MIRHLQHLWLVGVAAMALGCGVSAPTAPPTATTSTDGPNQALHALFEREWQWRLADAPLMASSIGDHRFDDRLPNVSPESFAARATQTEAFLAELGRIDRTTLSATDRINYDMFKAQLEERRDAWAFDEHLMPLNADSGFHTELALMPRQMAFAALDDYKKYQARLDAIPQYIDGQIALMREGLRKGMTIPRVSLAGIETSIAPLAGGTPEQHALWEPFARIPATIDPAAREQMTAAARQRIAGEIIPAYARFLTFMTTEYVPGARETLAATVLPRGQEYYASLVRRFTTLDLDAEQVHQIGLEQVAALQKEMDVAMRATGFSGSFAAFLQFLRTDPRFYAKTADELLSYASFIAKKMDGKLPGLFGRLPRQPYGVAPVPAYLAPKYTAGRYNGNPPTGTEPGYYWVNTHALDTRPLYNLEALTLHEAVPGHHLQIALSYELDDIPPFRRWTYISTFGEGWGLYSEWLGLEAGFYTDPYSNFGRLTYAMWRAVRLVVDTGIHAKGWTRQQAIDYLASHTALSVHECTTEVDRYISWPGQALSYKIGELKIRELRARAEKALGPRFDIRAFHDVVLGNGSVPMSVLEQMVDAYIASPTER